MSTANPIKQALRSVLISATVVQFFAAISTVPLADTVAVFFVYPFIVTALSPIVLHERVGAWRWSAVIAGFIGAIVIVRPSLSGVSPGMLYALGAGVTYSLFVLVTRRLAGSDPALKTSFMTGLGATLMISFAVPFVWVTPPANAWLAIVMIGLLGSVFSLLVILSYEYASPSALAPFAYVEIAAAALIGWIAFSELPDSMTWVGIIIIAVAGVTIAIREQVRSVPSIRRLVRR